MPRSASFRRNAKRKSTLRIAGVLGAAVLALSACAALSGHEPPTFGAEAPRVAAQRPNPPTMLRSERNEAGGLFVWAPPRQGAQPSFYSLTIEPIDGAMARIGPVRVAATGAEIETMQALRQEAGTTLVRWSVRACNDAPAAALRGALAGNCSLPASGVLHLDDRPGAASLATFTIGAGAAQS